MCSARKWTESRIQRWCRLSCGSKLLPCCTFIPGIDKQVISRARALLAPLVGDGEEGCGGHRLGAAAVVAPPLGPAGGLRVGAACAAASLSEGRRRTVAVWNVLGLLQKCFKCMCFGHWFWNSPGKAPKVQPSPAVAEDSKVRNPLLIGPHDRGRSLCVGCGDSHSCLIARPPCRWTPSGRGGPLNSQRSGTWVVSARWRMKQHWITYHVLTYFQNEQDTPL